MSPKIFDFKVRNSMFVYNQRLRGHTVNENIFAKSKILAKPFNTVPDGTVLISIKKKQDRQSRNTVSFSLRSTLILDVFTLKIQFIANIFDSFL